MTHHIEFTSMVLVALLAGSACGASDSGEMDPPSAAGTGAMTASTTTQAEPTQTTPAASTPVTAPSAAAPAATASAPSAATTQAEPTQAPTATAAPAPPDATGAVFTDDFETGATNWEVIQGSCLPTQDATMVLTCTNGGNEARAVAGDPAWTDLTVSANVMIRQIDDGKRVYLAGRFTDADNWYGAAFYASGTRKVQLRKKVEGSSDDVAATDFEWQVNQWYTLQLRLSGATLSLSVDGVPLLEATDETFASGRIALLADSSEVSWDNVVVTTP